MRIFENYEEPLYFVNGNKGVIVGRTETMIDLFRYINHLATLPTTVLLRGETGTGKELFARALHYNGGRQNQRNNFVAVNCAGIPPELLESELFGYVKGAFTGAEKNTEGKFQYANGGTILLDEIGDMSPHLQAKILRVLQEKQVTRVGGNEPEKVNVRIVATTNRDLEELIEKKAFREDLYYRLNVIPIKLPPLRERREDIPLIADYFVKKYNAFYNANIEGLNSPAKERLKWAEWKGNVRELENIVERAFVVRKDGLINPEDLLFGSEIPKRLLASIPVTVRQPTSEVKASATTDTIAGSAPVPEKVNETGTAQIPAELKSSISEDRPLRFLQGPGELPDLETSANPEATRGQRWYGAGVLPMSIPSLSNLRGSMSAYILHKLGNNGRVYADRTNGVKDKSQVRLVYLTHANIESFFTDPSTDDCKRLIEQIETNRFNEIKSRPFKFFTTADMVQNPHIFHDFYKLQDIIKGPQFFKVHLRRQAFAAALTEEFLPLFSAGQNQTREENLQALQEELRQSYQQFLDWEPHI